DAHVLETARARRTRKVGQVAAQRHLRAGHDEALPAPLLRVLREDRVELLHGFRLQPVHGAFDHAVLALQVALEVHRQLDVVLGGEAPPDGAGRGLEVEHCYAFFALSTKNGVSSFTSRNTSSRIPRDSSHAVY